MKYLLDTCVLLWALENNKKKLEPHLEIIENYRNFIAVSVVTYWEIAIKKSLGKLDSPADLKSVVEESGFEWINLEVRHIEQLEKLPLIHSDPFDRLLISQCLTDDYKILTADNVILKYFSKN